MPCPPGSKLFVLKNASMDGRPKNHDHMMTIPRGEKRPQTGDHDRMGKNLLTDHSCRGWWKPGSLCLGFLLGCLCSCIALFLFFGLGWLRSWLRGQSFRDLGALVFGQGSEPVLQFGLRGVGDALANFWCGCSGAHGGDGELRADRELIKSES